MMFDWTRISDRKFEELIAALLEDLGFVDVCLMPPGPDDGRDIEATWICQGPFGSDWPLLWHVDAKRHQRQIGRENVTGGLTGATTKRAFGFLLATNSFVSAAGRRAAKDWVSGGDPTLRVAYLEGAQLTALLSTRQHVVSKILGPALAETAQADVTMASLRSRLLIASARRWESRVNALQGIVGHTGEQEPAGCRAANNLAEWWLCREEAWHLIDCLSLGLPAALPASSASKAHFARVFSSLPPPWSEMTTCDLTRTTGLILDSIDTAVCTEVIALLAHLGPRRLSVEQTRVGSGYRLTLTAHECRRTAAVDALETFAPASSLDSETLAAIALQSGGELTWNIASPNVEANLCRRIRRKV